MDLLEINSTNSINNFDTYAEKKNADIENLAASFLLVSNLKEIEQICVDHTSLSANSQPANDIAECLVKYSHNDRNWPVVHYAIAQGRPDVAEAALLLYPEQATMRTTDLKLVKWLCGSDDQVLVGSEEGKTALELAIRKGFTDLAAKLLDLGANPSEIRTQYFGKLEGTWWKRGGNVHEYVKVVNSIGYGKYPNQTCSMLFWAIQADNKNLVELLLRHGASLEGIKFDKKSAWLGKTGKGEFYERTAIHQAACVASSEILWSLICYQKDPNNWGNQPIDKKVLLAFRMHANNESNLPPLHSAIKNGDFQAFNLMLKYGEDINWQGVAENTLLSMAVSAEDNRFLDLMMHYGLDTYEAINELVNQDKVDRVEKLLYLIESNNQKTQLLDRASEKGHMDIAVLLLNSGIRSGHAIELAIENDNLDLTRTLIEASGVVLSNLRGLDTAINSKSIDMVELLLKVGDETGDQFQKDREVEDALLSLSIKSGDKKIFALINNAGYWDSGLWNAFVDANEVDMLQDYLQNSKHTDEIKPELTSMKKRAMDQGQTEMLTYLMTL